MIDQIFEKRPKRRIRDLNIVPILDMLVTVIFFLLMSTSFMEYTKLTVPPASTSVISDANATPPMQPKMLVTKTGQVTRLILMWNGTKPGEARAKVVEGDEKKARKDLFEQSRKLVEEFVEKHAGEKTLQLGMGPEVPYQHLVSVMDGVMDKMPDVVLISYNEAEARATKQPDGDEK